MYHIVIVVEIYVILALAMDLLAGWSGLLSLAQAATYGTGAYITAILTAHVGISFPLALIAAMAFNGIMALPVAFFAVRLRDLYFTLATLAWQVLVFSVLYNWSTVTGGPYGIAGIPRPTLLGSELDTPLSFAVFGGVLAAFTLYFFHRLYRSPLARVYQGSRDDQLAFMALGKDPRRAKTQAILISSVVSGLAGALYATYSSYIDPGSFTLDESILVLSMVLIGGLGTIRGAVAGAALYVLLPEALRFLQMPDAMAANTRMILYAGILVGMVIYKPFGFFGRFRFAA